MDGHVPFAMIAPDASQ